MKILTTRVCNMSSFFNKKNSVETPLHELKKQFETNQNLLSCLYKLKTMVANVSSYHEKLELLQSFSFNQLTIETLLQYCPQKIDQSIHETLKYQNMISYQHHAFMHLQEHHDSFRLNR